MREGQTRGGEEGGKEGEDKEGESIRRKKRTNLALFASFLGDCEPFDTFLVVRAFDDPMDIDTRKMNLVRVKIARLKQILNFNNADLPGPG